MELSEVAWLREERVFSVWSASNCTCNTHPHITTFGSFSICNLPLVPSWLAAVILGVTFSVMFLRLGSAVIGSLSYAVTYAMYAVMISSGLVVHCLFLVECGGQSPTKMFTDFAKVDGSLTSSIAISFLINGLVDIKLIRDRSLGFVLLSLLSYVAVFYAYFTALIPARTLYVGSVMIGCSLYLLCQVAAMIRSQPSPTALCYLLLGGLFGGGSLWLILTHYCWLCAVIGAWSIQGVWYYGADLSMVFVGLYVWNTRSKLSENHEQEKPPQLHCEEKM